MTDSPDPAHNDELQRRIEAIAEEFLAGLQAGEHPNQADVLAAHPNLSEPLKRRLALVERLFRAGQNAKPGNDVPMPAERAHRLKCPHCGNRIQLVEPRPKEVTCVNCGSSFRVEPGTTATYRNTGSGGTIGRFQILELLGRGAFGEVYKARDSDLDRFVALKIPRTDYFATSEEEQRFLREARSAAGLRHPSIVQVHEIAQERGSPYIVSDYIDGLTLADLISGGRPAFRESAELVAQLADALDYAHRQKVVHRDIKPSNILLATGEGVSGGMGSGRAGVGAALDTHYAPFLADFGLARRDEGEITVTLDGQVLGTPAYMSPEQAAGDHARVDGRSDVYSLGVVLYELLSGELPFRGSRRMLLHQVLNDEPRPPRTLNDQIPRDLETVCLKAMAKEPGRRYLTAADFRDDLRRFLGGDPINARRFGRTERTWRWCRRNPLPAGLAAAVALALLAGTFVSLHFAQRAVTKAADADAKAADEARERKRADDNADEARHNLYVAHMNLAQAAYEASQIGKVLQFLDLYRQPTAGEPDLRGFEWYYLDRLCQADLCTLKLDCDRPSVAFDADCHHAAVVVAPDTIKVFDIRTGGVIRTLSKVGRSFQAVAISADGQRIAAIAFTVTRTASWESHADPLLSVWDTQAGEEIFTTVAGVHLSHERLVFSPDGRWIVSAQVNNLLGGSQGDAIVFDAHTGKVVLTLGGENVSRYNGENLVRPDGENVRDQLRGVVFSPDSKLIATRGVSFATLWEVSTGKRTLTIEVQGGRVLFPDCLAFSPDGQRLATGATGGVGVWDTSTGERVLTLGGHADDVTSVSFAPDGKRLASGSNDSTVRVWDLSSGHEILILRGHTSAVTDVAFATDGWRIASVDSGGSMKLWDSMTSHATCRLDGNIEGFHCVVFSPDGRLVASKREDRSVTIWDVATKRIIQTLHGPSSVRDIAFSSDGGRVAAASSQLAKIWDVASGNELATLNAPPTVDDGNINLAGIVFSPDGRRLAGIESSGSGVYVWDLASRQVEWSIPLQSGEDQSSHCIAFSPDGQRLAFNVGSELHVRDLDAGNDVFTLKGHSASIETIIYSRDGRHIVSGGDDAIRFWDVVSGRELPKFRFFVGKADRLALTAGGQRLISSQNTWKYDGGAAYKVWDVATGLEVFTLGDRPPGAFAVSPDGNCIALYGNDGIELLEGSPLTTDAKTRLEANGLVEFLYATEESKEGVIRRLHTVPAISDAVRSESLRLAKMWQLSSSSRRQLLADGETACTNNDYATAIRLFTRVITQYHSKADAFWARGTAYHNLGELDKAIGDYNEAIGLDPDNVSGLINRGTAWRAKCDLDKAIGDYNQAIRLDPKNVQVLISRGATWHQKGDFKKALADYNEAIRLYPNNPDAYNGRGVAWHGDRQYGKALADYDRAIHLDPDKALAGYDQAIRLAPGNSHGFFGRGAAWHAKGELDKAVADYDEAIRLDPKSFYAYTARGNAWNDNGELDKALADFDEAIRLEPKMSCAYRGRGKTWQAKGELDKAIADFDQAIRLDPEDLSAFANRAVSWDAKGELDRALADHNEAIRLDPNNAVVRNNRGASSYLKGDFDKAIADFDEAVRLDPNMSCAYTGRGNAWDAKGELEKAIADFDQAIRLDPNDVSALCSRGVIWHGKAEFDKALADYNEAIRLDPKNVLALTNRGALWKAKGKLEKAIADYDTAIEIDPKSMEAHVARAWIRATCPDEKYREGAKAVEDATKASDLADRKDSDILDTLAAAYAESGQFDKAVEWQEKAIELAPEDEKEEYRSRLKLYQVGKPYREEPKN